MYETQSDNTVDMTARSSVSQHNEQQAEPWHWYVLTGCL